MLQSRLLDGDEPGNSLKRKEGKETDLELDLKAIRCLASLRGSHDASIADQNINMAALRIDSMRKSLDGGQRCQV